jgi:SAM-dependent methyltransferase
MASGGARSPGWEHADMTSDSYVDVAAAYEGVERLDSFSAPELRAYRDELYARTEQHARFIAARLAPKARLLELGSGNGRLPLALARRGAVVDALGLEIAQSRVEFARAWAADDGVANVRFEVADVLQCDLPRGRDAVICITGAFAYFDAVRPGAGGVVLGRALEALRPGGLLVLEIYPHPHWRRLLAADGSGELRLWHELAPSDPWRFYLSHLLYDAQRRVLTHHKTFVHRVSGAIDDGRQEHLRLYNADELTADLQAAGFGEVSAYGDWSGGPCSPRDELLVICARRP